MVTVTFSIDSPALGRLAIPYEIPDEALQYLMMGLIKTYPMASEGPHLPQEYLRCLTDDFMEAQMSMIREVAKEVYSSNITHTALAPTITPPESEQ